MHGNRINKPSFIINDMENNYTCGTPRKKNGNTFPVAFAVHFMSLPYLLAGSFRWRSVIPLSLMSLNSELRNLPFPFKNSYDGSQKHGLLLFLTQQNFRRNKPKFLGTQVRSMKEFFRQCNSWEIVVTFNKVTNGYFEYVFCGHSLSNSWQ